MGKLVSNIAQRVLDSALCNISSRKSLRRKLEALFFRCARRILIRLYNDPLVHFELDGSRILLPLSHQLPFYRANYPDYSSNIGRIASHIYAKYEHMTMIDIGANVGDTAAIIRGHANIPTLCIEGDPQFFSILAQNSLQWQGVFLDNSFVGKTTEQINATYRAQDGSGYLTCLPYNPFSLITTKSLESILQDQPSFYNSQLIKIDTDGFDIPIIQGNLKYISDVKPIIFFEYDPNYFIRDKMDGFSIFHCLYSVGYKTALFFENTDEFLLECALNDDKTLKAMHNLSLRKRGHRYSDVCVGTEKDHDILVSIRRSEMERFHSFV